MTESSKQNYNQCGFEFVRVFDENTVWYNNNPLPLRLAIPYSETYPNISVRRKDHKDCDCNMHLIVEKLREVKK